MIVLAVLALALVGELVVADILPVLGVTLPLVWPAAAALYRREWAGWLAVGLILAGLAIDTWRPLEGAGWLLIYGLLAALVLLFARGGLTGSRRVRFLLLIGGVVIIETVMAVRISDLGVIFWASHALLGLGYSLAIWLLLVLTQSREPSYE